MVIAFRKNITWHVQLDAFIAQRSIISVWGPVEWVEDQLNGLGCPGVMTKMPKQISFLQLFCSATLNGRFLLNTFAFEQGPDFNRMA